MSTDFPADPLAEAPDLTKVRRRSLWTKDLRTARVLRFALGVTAAVAVAFAFEWPLSFLTPVFTAVFLALPISAPTLGLVLFHIFYLLNRGGSFWRVLMLLIAVLILPMLGQPHDVFPVGFSLYFILSGVLAVLFSVLAHGLFPDPTGGPALPPRPAAMRGYLPVAALAALKTTLVVLPIAVLFIAMEWTGEILVMVFAAIFSLSPQISKGRVAALNSLKSTFIGGLAALVFYWLIVAVPEFHFFVALMLLTALLFGQGRFRQQPSWCSPWVCGASRAHRKFPGLHGGHHRAVLHRCSGGASGGHSHLKRAEVENQSMTEEKVFVSNALEATIRIGILLLLAAWCFQIVQPFIIPIVWGIIIAIGTYPAFLSLQRRLGGRRGLSATLITLIGLLILILPTVMLSSTLIDSAHGLADGLQEGTIAVPPPPENVKDWPMVGEKLDAFWRQASQNLAATAAKIAPQLKAVGSWLLSTAAGAGFGILKFVIAIIIAGVLLANAEAGGKAVCAIFTRLAGQKGAEFAKLAEATVRSVTRGILGVALIQTILIGLGFLVMGIPGAGLWALLCLILSAIQIGPFLIVLPILIYVFSTADTVPAVLFLIWSIFAGSIDNILKPILLGRGVEVPMAVIFVGAIGGFITSGIIGLFVGAVMLVLGYKLFLAWLDDQPNAEPSGTEKSQDVAAPIANDSPKM